MPLSGAQWVSQFQSSKSLDDLVEPFRSKAKNFVAALRVAQATVTINDTLRRKERAYLMHYAYVIAREGAAPESVPPMTGVNIQWVHTDGAGHADLAASKAAAQAMVDAYDIVFKPALTSRHIEGNAVDMDISWLNNLAIAKSNGSIQTITSTPRTGAANTDLHQTGASYGVFKLLSDAPHWSSDGH
jgi:hypothetical protein